MNFTIGNAAKELNVSIHTLRYYEKEGLLLSINRDASGKRIYTESDIQWIYMVRCLRDTGMPIREIKKYISLFKQGASTISERKEILIKFQEYVTQQIKLFTYTSSMLKKKLEYYDVIEKSVTDGEGNRSDSCYDYFQEWENFKQVLKEDLNE